MADLLQYAVLGLGTGAVYGIMGLGLTLSRRASHVLNLAHGAVGLVAAFVAYDLRTDGLPTALAVGVGVALGAVLNGLIYLTLVHPLRDAPELSRLLTTAGAGALLTGLAVRVWTAQPLPVTDLLPTEPVRFGSEITVGSDRLVLLVIGLALALAVTGLIHATRFGHLTSALARSDEHVAAVGTDPRLIGFGTWAVAGALAAIASILVVNITGLVVGSLAVLLVPAIAATTAGGSRSALGTFAAGLLLGVAEIELGQLDATSGLATSLPLLAVLVIAVARGSARRDWAPRHTPLVDRGRRTTSPGVTVGVTAFVTLLALVVPLDDRWTAALTLTGLLALVLCSQVVVTGLAGDASLAQLGLAGVGAWAASRMTATHGVGLEVAVPTAAMAAAVAGSVLGLLRHRAGRAELAAVSLLFAALVERVIGAWSGAAPFSALAVGPARLAGVAIDPLAHPARYLAVVLAALGLGAATVVALRRSWVGPALHTLHDDPTAALTVGLSTRRLVVVAYTVSGALAGVAGALLALRLPTVDLPGAFTALDGLTVALRAVVGGVGFVVGTLLGASTAPGGPAWTALDPDRASSSTWLALLGLGSLVVLRWRPAGLASLLPRRPKDPTHLPVHGSRPVRSTGQAGLVLEGLKVFADSPTIDLTIDAESVVGITGRNGVGKTSLALAIVGLRRPVDGRIHLHGQDISAWPTDRRARAGLRLGLQGPRVFSSLTAGENLVLPSGAASPRSGGGDAGPALVAAVGLDRDPRPAIELSYGQRRTVVAGRTLSGSPGVVILDEPAAALSVTARARLAAAIRDVAGRGTAVLVIEHDLTFLTEVSDVIHELSEDGLGPPQSPDPLAAGDPIETVTRTGVVGEPRAGAHHLRVGYLGQTVVTIDDLDIRAGEVVALLGPNGSGKSTVLDTIAGVLAPLGGDLHVLGSTTPPLYRSSRRGLTYVPADSGLVPDLTVGQNLRLSRTDITETLNRLPMDLSPSMPANRLSEGQRRLLGLARSVDAHPGLLLVDELTTGLSADLAGDAIDRVRSAAAGGAAVLVSDQDEDRARRVADRVYRIEDGALVPG